MLYVTSQLCIRMCLLAPTPTTAPSITRKIISWTKFSDLQLATQTRPARIAGLTPYPAYAIQMDQELAKFHFHWYCAVYETCRRLLSSQCRVTHGRFSSITNVQCMMYANIWVHYCMKIAFVCLHFILWFQYHYYADLPEGIEHIICL